MKGKFLLTDDRVRVVRGEYIGQEGVIWKRDSYCGLAKRVVVLLDGHPRGGKKPGVLMSVLDVELIEPCPNHIRLIRNKLIRAGRGNDDQ